MLSCIVAPLLCWYERNARPLPWRENRDPYRIWISEIMLQQTRVETVLPYYRRVLAELPDVAALAAVSEERLLKLWEGLGYYSRARNLKRAAQEVMARRGGRFPDSAEELAALPGIGAYTAGAIASIAFGKPEPAVDGNVLRVMARLRADEAVPGEAARRRVAAELKAVYPAGRCGDFTQSLMELGATVCLPNGAPRCGICPLAERCEAHRLNRTADFPVRAAARRRRIEERTVLLWCVGRQVGIRRRPEGGLLGGLWEFPSESGRLAGGELRAEFPAVPEEAIRPCGSCRHAFTHVEWRMTGYFLDVPELPDGLCAADAEKLDNEISLPAAFRPFAEAWKERIAQWN